MIFQAHTLILNVVLQQHRQETEFLTQPYVKSSLAAAYAMQSFFFFFCLFPQGFNKLTQTFFSSSSVSVFVSKMKASMDWRLLFFFPHSIVGSSVFCTLQANLILPRFANSSLLKPLVPRLRFVQ